MNSRGRIGRDLCPEDLLTVAKNCLDLLMRPDKEFVPWACYSSTVDLWGWMNHRKEGRKKETSGGKMLKVGSLGGYFALQPSAIYWPLQILPALSYSWYAWKYCAKKG